MKPNVIFVFADQWRAQATGYNGDVNAITPCLDQLAEESVNFTNAVSGCPVCTPWRASMLTGLYPLNHGLIVNDMPLDPSLPAAGEIFKDAGYDTAYIGKWHVDGHGRESFIPKERRHGFDYWKVLECTHDYNKSFYYADTPQLQQWEGYDALAQTEDAVNFINKQGGNNPFCLFLSWGPPHAPYDTAPEKYREKYTDRDIILRANVPAEDAALAAKELAGYYAHIAALDNCLDLLLDCIEQQGIRENTIFVFTSDHGDMLGSHGARKKQQPYDESVRVPFLIRYPAQLKAGQNLDALIDAPDILPSLLGLCGIEHSLKFDGLDYSGYMKGAEMPDDGTALLCSFVPFGQWPRNIGGREYRGVRNSRYTYTESLDGPWLLFDNEKDPEQMNNLCQLPEYATVQKQLQQTLKRKLAEKNDEFFDSVNIMRKSGYFFNHSKNDFTNHTNICYDIGPMQAKWIYPGQFSEPNSFMRFKHNFKLSEVDSAAKLYISADSDYAVWLNGKFIDCGQFPDFPEEKTYDSLTVGEFLAKGENSLMILHYWRGIDCSISLKGHPGLIYALKSGRENINSGLDTLYKVEKGYQQGVIPRISPQMGFVFEYNACKAEEDDEQWHQIKENDFCVRRQLHPLTARPVKKTIIEKVASSRIIAQGFFQRSKKTSLCAEAMYRDLLMELPAQDLFITENNTNSEYIVPSPHGIKFNIAGIPNNADGIYLIFDFGSETCGFPKIDIEADEGTVVEIAYGQHLDDQRVRSFISGRNFASGYICREGHNLFTHYFTRWSGRYLQLHIHKPGCEFKLHYAGLVPCIYPVAERGNMVIDDPLHEKIYQTAVHTLRLCMHEHYEDTPWREQALYANDARLQALCGYYCFGEYEFPAASIGLLGNSIREDAWLELCAPAKIAVRIPSFTFAWILMVRDYLLYAGDPDGHISKWLKIIKIIIKLRLEEVANSLLPLPSGEGYWHFYDWAPGVNGLLPEGSFTMKKSNGKEFESPLNLFFVMALDASAEIAEYCQDNVFAEQCIVAGKCCREAIAATFWDDRQKAFFISGTPTGRYCFSEMSQSLALITNALPPGCRSILLEKLASDKSSLVPLTLSQSFFKFEALLSEQKKYGDLVFKLIADIWGEMLSAGATSFWETSEGAEAFGKAGSLCHGWSALPVYFYFSALAGIKPYKPGFSSYINDAMQSDIRIQANIPTPGGSIKINTLGETRKEGIHNEIVQFSTWNNIHRVRPAPF